MYIDIPLWNYFNNYNNYFLSNLLETLSNENKTVVVLRDFNADLLKYKKDSNISGFLDIIKCIQNNFFHISLVQLV